MSEEQAKSQLEKRQKKSEEVAKLLSGFRDAVRELTAFTDAGALIDRELKLEGSPGSRLRVVIDRLRVALDEAARGLVEFREDGTWIMERDIPFAVQQTQQAECKTSRLVAQSEKMTLESAEPDPAEYFKVGIQTCGMDSPLNFAYIRAPKNELPEIRFYPELLGEFTASAELGGACRGTLGAREFTLRCEPSQIDGDGFTLATEAFEIQSRRGSTFGNYGAAVWHHRSGKVYWVHVDFQPGRALQFTCRQASINEPGREQSCALPGS